MTLTLLTFKFKSVEARNQGSENAALHRTIFTDNITKSLKHKIFDFLKKRIVRWNVLNTVQPKRAKSVEKLRRYYRNTEKKRKKSSFCVKFDLVCRGARLHFIAKRLGRPSFFIKRSHLSNIRVKSEGVVAAAWIVGVE